MRIQTGLLVSLGYGRFVRSDEVVAVEPITEGRGPGRRCLVWVRGVPDPIVASRSQQSIIDDLTRPAEPVVGAAPAAVRVPARGLRGPTPARAVAAVTRKAAPKPKPAAPRPGRRRPLKRRAAGR